MSGDFEKDGMLRKLIACRGLPASGKSTFAEAEVRRDPHNTARVNQDSLRKMLHAEWFTPDKVLERRIAATKEHLIEFLMGQQIAVIICDDTNLHPQSIPTLQRLAKAHRYDFEVKDFTDVPVEECIRRDAARLRSVGWRVINGMADRYGLVKPELAGV